ncbi:hypothetical protein APSETT444_003243 [Aspergillus pseudonomiae]
MSPTRNFLDMENGMGCLSLDRPVNSERAQAESSSSQQDGVILSKAPSESRIDGEFIAVQWNGPEDPENPQNFTFARKCLISASLSLMTLCVTFASSVFSEVTVVTAKDGGFIVDSYLGWRWTAWITMIGAAFFGAVSFVLVPETYSPVLLQRRAACLRRQTGNPAFRAPLETHQPTWVDMITRYLFRPLKMLFLEPILDCLTIYISLIYGILYLFFESYPVAFTEVRGWTQLGVAALPFLAILVGVLCGGGLIIVVTKTRFVRQLERHGYVIPEERLPPMMIAAVLLPAGLFWFAWTSKPEVSWVAQTIAGVPIGCGILVVFMQGLNYLVDVYLPFANSAMAANTLVRCSFGGAFPLFATQMFHRLGVAWATSLLGFLTVAMIPIPTLLFVYGKRIRSLSRFSMAEERQ